MPENIGSWRVMEKAGMRYQGLASYFGLDGLKKYVAERAWWSPPSPECVGIAVERAMFEL